MNEITNLEKLGYIPISIDVDETTFVDDILARSIQALKKQGIPAEIIAKYRGETIAAAGGRVSTPETEDALYEVIKEWFELV